MNLLMTILIWKTNFLYRGREFDFKKYELTTYYHPEFIHTLCSLASSIKDRSLDTMNGDWLGIRFFLNVVQKERLPLYEYLSIDNAASKLKFGGASEWQNSLSVVRDHIDAEFASSSNKSNYLCGAQFFIDKLAEKNHIPRISPIRGFKKTRSTAKTVVDIPLSKEVRENILGITSDSNIDEIQTVYQHVLLELTDVEKVSDGFHSLSITQKVEWVLSRRLGGVRDAIDQQIEAQLEIRKQGLFAIRKYRDLNNLLDEYLNFNKGPGYINPAKEKLMTFTYEKYRFGLLSWFWYRNNGIQLKDYDKKRYNAATKILNELRKREGLPQEQFQWSDTWFANRLGLSSDMYTPCILLLIFDNFMNVSNARTIPIDGLTKNSDGLTSISWFKNRSASWITKLVNNEPKFSSIDVFKHVKRATRRYRKYCVENGHRDQQNHLFLAYYSTKKHKEVAVRPLNPSSTTFTEHAKNFFSMVSENRWYMTADMLRSSLLLLSGLQGGIEAIKGDAQHQDARSSSIYHDRPAVRAIFHEEMRKFKQWLETLITLNIDDAPLKLGIDPKRYEGLKQQILASRFGGLFCQDPMAGVQAGTRKGSPCNKIARCLLCKNKRNMFVESLENIVHLLQWHEALQIGVNKGEIDANENINWFFWFRFIEEMIARLTNNPLSKLRNEALINDAQTRMTQLKNPYLNIDFREVS